MKKFLFMISTAVLFCCCLSTAYAVTRSDAALWALEKADNGWGEDQDGNGLWCIDLIKAYQSYLDLKWRSGDARDYETGADGCTKIAYSNGVHAEVGDIAVWKAGTSEIGKYGHAIPGAYTLDEAVDVLKEL